MKLSVVLFCLFFSFTTVFAQSDATREAWDKAKTLCNNSQYKEAKPFLETVYKEMPRPLCCYWLGLAYDLEGDYNNAVKYYDESIKNSRKPQLAAWDNMLRAHLRQLDFETAYKKAWEAMQTYPGNKVFIEEFKEICKWAYFIKHTGFDESYLSSTQLHKEYKINTITEQYLIVKNVRNENGKHLHIGNRQYKGNYELWKGMYNGSKESIDIKFHLNDHDLDRQLAKQHEAAKAVYNDKSEAIHIRLGALLALTPLSDKQMLDLLASDQEAIRLCTCLEVSKVTSKKVKKACLKDASEIVQATAEALEVFE